MSNSGGGGAITFFCYHRIVDGGVVLDSVEVGGRRAGGGSDERAADYAKPSPCPGHFTGSACWVLAVGAEGELRLEGAKMCSHVLVGEAAVGDFPSRWRASLSPSQSPVLRCPVSPPASRHATRSPCSLSLGLSFSISRSGGLLFVVYTRIVMQRAVRVWRIRCRAEPSSQGEPEPPLEPSLWGIPTSTWSAGLGALGFLETGYLTYLKFSGAEAFCPVGGASCSDVLNSDYSSVFGSLVGLPSVSICPFAWLLVDPSRVVFPRS
ncbi:hypothetical protein GW17_00033646 [Ensete ventricosum]|nr:hypothetical protein GW17_00033646 [Ensete ventricosum]